MCTQSLLVNAGKQFALAQCKNRVWSWFCKRTARNASLRCTYVFGRSSTLACQCTLRPIPVAYQLVAEAQKWATSGLISMTTDLTTFYSSSFQA